MTMISSMYSAGILLSISFTKNVLYNCRIQHTENKIAKEYLTIINASGDDDIFKTQGTYPYLKGTVQRYHTSCGRSGEVQRYRSCTNLPTYLSNLGKPLSYFMKRQNGDTAIKA
jgi:hypothetical protein